MSAAAFITTQLYQLLLVCEKHSQGLKALLRIKGASHGGAFHDQTTQVEILKVSTDVFASLLVWPCPNSIYLLVFFLS